jgi:NAD-dependent SIR2 family protein deacetylase
MELSLQSIEKCDLLIVIGSSLQVAPANMCVIPYDFDASFAYVEIA